MKALEGVGGASVLQLAPPFNLADWSEIIQPFPVRRNDLEIVAKQLSWCCRSRREVDLEIVGQDVTHEGDCFLQSGMFLANGILLEEDEVSSQSQEVIDLIAGWEPGSEHVAQPDHQGHGVSSCWLGGCTKVRYT